MFVRLYSHLLTFKLSLLFTVLNMIMMSQQIPNASGIVRQLRLLQTVL